MSPASAVVARYDLKPAYLTNFRREGVETPSCVAARTGSRCRHTRQYVKPAGGSTAAQGECIGVRSRKLVRYAG